MEGQIPERRPAGEELEAYQAKGEIDAHDAKRGPTGTLPVWRCKVCGYLCARERPPNVCPICKADQDRFEEFPL